MKPKKGNNDLKKVNTTEKNKAVMCYDLYRENGYDDGVTINASHEESNSKKQAEARLKTVTVKSSNAVAFSTNASGGRTCFIDQNIVALSRTASKPSLFIVDSDSELYCRHAKSLKQRGYKVWVLDFDNPNGSDKWNPFAALVWRIKLIRELTNEVENRDGKYYAMGEMYKTYKDVRARLEEIRNELYKSVDDIIKRLFNLPIEDEYADLARKLISAFTIAICEDCIASQLGISQLILTNVCQNLLEYAKKDISVIQNYLIDKRDMHSKAREMANDIFHGDDRKNLLKIMESVIHIVSANMSDRLLNVSCESWIDLFSETDSQIAVFINLRTMDETIQKYIQLFLEQTYRAREEVIEVAKKRTNFIVQSPLRPYYYIINGYDYLPNLPFDDDTFTAVNPNRKLILIAKSYAQVIKKYGTTFNEWLKNECKVKLFLSADNLDSRREYCELCCRRLEQVDLEEIDLFDKVNGVGNAVVAIEDTPPFITRFTPSYKIITELCPEGERKEPVYDDELSYWGSCFDIKKQLEKLNLGSGFNEPYEQDEIVENNTEVD